MNRQAIFNTVVARAKIAQKSLVPVGDDLNTFSGCRYRLDLTPGSLPCFIGALIPNDLYTPEMDQNNGETDPAGTGVLYLFAHFPAVREVLGVEVSDEELKKNNSLYQNDDLKFLDRLQIIHDMHGPDHWPDELKQFAEEYSLTMPTD